MSDWVNCPICGEPDMMKEGDGDGFIIHCVNLDCASNGGENASGLKEHPKANGIASRLFEISDLLTTDEGGSVLCQAATRIKSLESQNSKLREAVKVAAKTLLLAKQVTANGFLPNPHTGLIDQTHFDVHANINSALSLINSLELEQKEKVE